MDPTYRIRNDKGLFVPVHQHPLLSKATVDGIRREIWPAMEGKAKIDLGAALDALESLPVFTQHINCTRFDALFDPVKHEQYMKKVVENRTRHRPSYEQSYLNIPNRQSERVDCYGWYAPDTARGASGSVVACSNAQAAGWLSVGAFAKHIDVVNGVLVQIESDPVNKFFYRGAHLASKRAQELVFELVEHTEEFSCADYWLVFNGATSAGGGFLDTKGRYGPLARARGFESAVAAKLAAKSRKMSQWKVVQGRTELVALMTFPGDSVADTLAAAMSRQESMALSKALDTATIEALKSRLAQLEAVQEIQPAARKNRL